MYDLIYYYYTHILKWVHNLGLDSRCRVWDLRTLLLYIITAHFYDILLHTLLLRIIIMYYYYTHTLKLLHNLGLDSLCRVWDLRTGRSIMALQGDGPYSTIWEHILVGEHIIVKGTHSSEETYANTF